MRMSNPRSLALSGYTLLEIVCALVVFFIGCLFLFKMFHLAIWSSGSISDDALASIIARKKMEGIRAWAFQKSGTMSNFENGNWSALNGAVEIDPDYQKFTIRTFNSITQLASPSSSIQPQISLSSSARIIKVEVSWDAGARQKNFSLVTIVGAPRRELAAVRIYPAAVVSLGPLESETFTAVGVDSSGNEIKDLNYYWAPRPGSATGTLESRTGQSVDFSNYVYIKGDETAQDGTCRISSRTQSGGVEKNGYSNSINLYD